MRKCRNDSLFWAKYLFHKERMWGWGQWGQGKGGGGKCTLQNVWRSCEAQLPLDQVRSLLFRIGTSHKPRRQRQRTHRLKI